MDLIIRILSITLNCVQEAICGHPLDNMFLWLYCFVLVIQKKPFQEVAFQKPYLVCKSVMGGVSRTSPIGMNGHSVFLLCSRDFRGKPFPAHRAQRLCFLFLDR